MARQRPGPGVGGLLAAFGAGFLAACAVLRPWLCARPEMGELKAPAPSGAPARPETGPPPFKVKPSPKCVTPPAGAPRPQDDCRSCYMETLKATMGGEGSDIVLGANDGLKYDPAGNIAGYWAGVPQHTKVFVEPVPPIFAKLRKNMKEFPNMMLLNTAVRTASQPSELVLYCWDLDMIEETLKHGAAPLPPEVRQPLEYWQFLCAIENKSLIDASNVLWTPEYEKLAQGDKNRVLAQLQKRIVSYRVPALTPQEIVDKVGSRTVRYVQIDVEGMDNQIMSALPFGQGGFWPEVVLWENHDGDLVRPVVERQGYFTCCCVNFHGNNLLAVRNHPGAAGALK